MIKKVGEHWNEIFFALMVIGCIVLYYILAGETVWSGERVLYADDLEEYYVMTDPDTTLAEKVFDTSANKTRYVLNIMLIVFFALVGNSFERIDTILLCWNAFLTISFFFLIYWLIKSEKYYLDISIAGGAALLCACSRFSYYNMTEVFGLMEGASMLLAIAFMVLLIKDNFSFKHKYWLANIVYIIVIYIHERYFVLAGILVLYIFIGIVREKKILSFLGKLIVSVLIPLLFFLQRSVVLGERALDGTGGTAIADTFSIKQFLKFCIHQVGYLIGINTRGEQYLNGVDPLEVPIIIYFLTFFVLMTWVIIMCIYIRQAIQQKCLVKRMQIPALMMAAMACMIVSSSVTIRVELRWVYVSWTLFLTMMAYMLSVILKNEQQAKTWLYQMLIMCLVCLMLQESYYRNKWNNLYYWGERELSSSFIEQLNKEDSIIEKITIISSDYLSWNEENVKKMCNLYGVEVNEVEFVNNTNEVDIDAEIVLLKLPAENRFCDITETTKKIYSKNGWYSDGWMEPNTEIVVFNEQYKKIEMRLSYASDIAPNGIIDVYVNGENKGNIVFDEDNLTQEFIIEDVPQGRVEIKLVANYYVIENSGRSEDGRLTCLLEYVRLIPG